MSQFDLSELERDEREHYESIVALPGKFYNEHPACPYFWEICLDGAFDGYLGDFGFAIDVTTYDRRVFPDLAGTDVVVLIDAPGSGVVSMRRFTLAEYEKFINELPTEPAGEWSIPNHD
jgi:hypothetical protein